MYLICMQFTCNIHATQNAMQKMKQIYASTDSDCLVVLIFTRTKMNNSIWFMVDLFSVPVVCHSCASLDRPSSSGLDKQRDNTETLYELFAEHGKKATVEITKKHFYIMIRLFFFFVNKC